MIDHRGSIDRDLMFLIEGALRGNPGPDGQRRAPAKGGGAEEPQGDQQQTPRGRLGLARGDE